MRNRLIFIFIFYSCFGLAQTFEKSHRKTDKLIHKFQKKYTIPGISVSIAINDSIVYSKGFGFSDIEQQKPVDPASTKFRIASITKSLTALTIGKLMEMDAIDISKNVHFYLKDLPKKNYDFTIKDVGGHVAGIIRTPTGERYDCSNEFTKESFYPAFLNDSLVYKPKTRFSYSNYGYKLLGLVIEKQCGFSVTDCHRKLILDKLQLDNITPDFTDNPLLNTSFYVEKNGKNIVAPCLDCTFKEASGCYIATSEDLVKLANGILYPNRLLKKETLIELIKSQKTLQGTNTKYGFGFMSLTDVNGHFYFGHKGGLPGTTTEYRVYPNSKMVIVILTNKSGKFSLHTLMDKIAHYYIK